MKFHSGKYSFTAEFYQSHTSTSDDCHQALMVVELYVMADCPSTLSDIIIIIRSTPPS